MMQDYDTISELYNHTFPSFDYNNSLNNLDDNSNEFIFNEKYLPKLLENKNALLSYLYNYDIEGFIKLIKSERIYDYFTVYNVCDHIHDKELLGCKYDGPLNVKTSAHGKPILLLCGDESNFPVLCKYIGTGLLYGKFYEKYNAIGLDSFLNESLVSFYLNYIGIPLFPNIYGSIICGREGILCMEYLSGGNFEKYITNSIDMSFALLQLISGLDFLMDKYDYIHGDLKIENVLISNESFSERLPYQDKDNIYISNQERNSFHFNFTVKIIDAGHSSISIRDYQTNNSIRIFPMYMGPTYTGEFKLLIDNEGREYYKIPNLITATYIEWRNSVYPLFKSLDIYVFFVSLMLQNETSIIIRKDRNLYNTWMSLFFPEEAFKMDHQIKNVVDNTDEEYRRGTSICLKQLKGFKLMPYISKNLLTRLLIIVTNNQKQFY